MHSAFLCNACTMYVCMYVQRQFAYSGVCDKSLQSRFTQFKHRRVQLVRIRCPKQESLQLPLKRRQGACRCNRGRQTVPQARTGHCEGAVPGGSPCPGHEEATGTGRPQSHIGSGGRRLPDVIGKVVSRRAVWCHVIKLSGSSGEFNSGVLYGLQAVEIATR